MAIRRCNFKRIHKFPGVTPVVHRVEYAVRGPIVVEANRIRDAIAHAKAMSLPSPYPFDSLIYCNIGNPQQVGQSALTYVNEGLAYFHAPKLLGGTIPEIASYCQRLLPGLASGAYTDSAGFDVIRRSIARFITERDVTYGVKEASEPSAIFLTDGASSAAKLVLQAMLGSPQDAMLVPVPLYPLYTAIAPLMNCAAEGYLLSCEQSWRVAVDPVRRAYEDAKRRGVTPRVLVVINPGNPTGAVLAHRDQDDLLKYCEEVGMSILADEVYQQNIYGSTPFRSFRAAACLAKSPVPIASLHSASKGYAGECGRRGGYVELHNFDAPVVAAVQKLASINLCSNIVGQFLMGMLCCPPTEGKEAALFMRERDGIIEDLCKKAKIVSVELNAIPGVRCAEIEGAMYAFPQITLPSSYIEQCERPTGGTAAAPADACWALGLLRQHGIVVVPGTGFGMPRSGRQYYFRLTILPTADCMARALGAIRKYHESLCASYDPN